MRATGVGEATLMKRAIVSNVITEESPRAIARISR